MSKRNLTYIYGSAVALVLVSLMGAGVLLAAPEGKGSLSGRILYDDGKPAVGLSLRLEKFQPMGLGEPGGGRKKGKTGGWESGAVGLQAGGGGTKIIGRATTDQNGNFSMQNVEAGGATLVGGSQKIGWVYQPVEIEPNKETKIGEIKLVKTD